MKLGKSTSKTSGQTTLAVIICVGVVVAGCKGTDAPTPQGKAAPAPATEKAVKPAEVAKVEAAVAPEKKQPEAPPINAVPSPPPVTASPKGRPAHMPCEVMERIGTNISSVYKLRYGEAGHLTRTTEQVVLAKDCPILDDKCRELLSPEKMATTYTYNALGRMEGAMRDLGEGHKATMKLAYNPEGKLSSYEYTEELDDGSLNHHTGTVSYGLSGDIAGIAERGKVFVGGMQDASTDFTVISKPDASPYSSSVVLWPVGFGTPYLGWGVARQDVILAGKYGGHRTVTEKYEFDKDGRIVIMSHDSGGVWGFSYDCPEK